MARIKTAGSVCNATIIEKRSRFIGYIKSVNSEDEAESYINEIKTMNRDATHNVFAYHIGSKVRYSDDGEPQGTAGKPVLDLLIKEEIDNTVIVITRYFGGILLGPGGLVRAYTLSAKEAINAATIVYKYSAQHYCLQFSYSMISGITRLLDQLNVIVDKTDYLDNVTLYCYIPTNKTEHITNTIKATFYEGLTIVSLGDIRWFNEE